MDAPSKPLIIAPLPEICLDTPSRALFVLKSDMHGREMQRAHIAVLRPICQLELMIDITTNKIAFNPSIIMPVLLAIVSAGSSLQPMSRNLVGKSVLMLVLRFASPVSRPLLMIAASTLFTMVSTVCMSFFVDKNSKLSIILVSCLTLPRLLISSAKLTANG